MIQLTEKDLKYIIKESINRYLINENQESASQHAAIKLAMQHGMDEKRAEQFVRIELRNDIPSLRDKKGAKFTLGIARMYFNRQIQNAQTINSLNQTLKLLASAHYDEYDRNLNGMSAQELIERFKSTIEGNVDKDREELAKIQFQKNDNYKIIPINSYEEAEQYYRYTYEGSPWCLTHMEDMFNSYTEDGMNQLYFCFRNGFENEKPVEGEGCPLDSYGTSMISVIVNENGSLAHSTCRWNHANGGSDSVLTTRQISELIGENFYNVFKPSHKWQDALENAKQKLSNGEDPKNIFDSVYDFKDGYATVELSKKRNFIDIKGNFLSDTWFDWAGNFNEGFAYVELSEKWNFIDTKGNILSDIWFDWVGIFNDGYANIRLNDKYNFIDREGNILSFNDYVKQRVSNGERAEKVFDWTGNFNDGYARIRLFKKYNFIDTKGNILSDTWFDETYNFKNGFAGIYLNKKYNFIDTKGNILSDTWFDEIYNFKNGFAKVELYYDWCYIDTKGNFYDKNKNPIEL